MHIGVYLTIGSSVSAWLEFMASFGEQKYNSLLLLLLSREDSSIRAIVIVELQIRQGGKSWSGRTNVNSIRVRGNVSDLYLSVFVVDICRFSQLILAASNDVLKYSKWFARSLSNRVSMTESKVDRQCLTLKWKISATAGLLFYLRVKNIAKDRILREKVRVARKEITKNVKCSSLAVHFLFSLRSNIG